MRFNYIFDNVRYELALDEPINNGKFSGMTKWTQPQNNYKGGISILDIKTKGYIDWQYVDVYHFPVPIEVQRYFDRVVKLLAFQ